MPNIFIEAMRDTLSYIPRTLIVMFISLFVSGFLMELGVLKKLEFIGRPLVRLARLPAESTITFITSVGSVVAGNTMLAKFYQEKKLERNEVFLSALLNGVPVYVKEIFTYQLPVIIPVLGLKVGGIYFLSFLAAGIVKIIFIILYGRAASKRYDFAVELPAEKDVSIARPYKDIIPKVIKREMKIFLRVSITFVSMTFIISLLTNNGAISRLKEIVQPMTDFFRLPVSAAIPVGTYMLSPLVGATSIGTMLTNGALSDFQAVVACMLGALLMLPVFSVRSSLANYTAIFGFSLGANIVLVSTILGMAVRAVFLAIFLFMI